MNLKLVLEAKAKENQPAAGENRTSLTLSMNSPKAVDIKTVSGMLGHFSAGFTLDTYAHVTTAAQRQAANTMGNVLSHI